MTISIQKFGTTLISRPAGREAFLALQPQLKDLQNDEKIVLDFNDVMVLTPGWADEFITPLQKKYSSRVTLINDDNPSIKAHWKRSLKPKKLRSNLDERIPNQAI